MAADAQRSALAVDWSPGTKIGAPASPHLRHASSRGGGVSCSICQARLRQALRHAAAVRAPLGHRPGPLEIATWGRLQAASGREVREALTAAACCNG